MWVGIFIVILPEGNVFIKFSCCSYSGLGDMRFKPIGRPIYKTFQFALSTLSFKFITPYLSLLVYKGTYLKRHIWISGKSTSAMEKT